MRYVLLILTAVCASAQPEVRLSPEPTARPLTVITHITGSNPDYVCKAYSTQDPATITVSAISNANPASFTATGHGFFYSATATQKIVVFISGLTGNWTPLNGFHVLTPTSANALAADVDSTSFGAVTGTAVVTTRAPNTLAKVWSVQAFGYDASNNQIISAWATRTAAINANTATGTTADLTGGTSAYAFTCAAPSAFE